MKRRILFALALVLIAVTAYAKLSRKWKIDVVECAWCDSTAKLEVHHLWPQHVRPDLAHDTNNMIVLCRRCHFCIGHRCNFKRVVTNVVEMIDVGRGEQCETN